MRFLVICAFVYGGSVAGALPTVRDVLADKGAEIVEPLLENGEVFRNDRQLRGALLMPDVPGTGRFEEELGQIDASVFSEGLYVVPYVHGAGEAEGVGETVPLDLYNMTRRLSGISGVEYFSVSRQENVTLFEDVYAVDGLRSRKRIEDPVVSRVPDEETVLIHMRELNLGAGYYEARYVAEGGTFMFFLRNASVLRKLIQIVDRGRMLMGLMFVPVEEGYLVYGASALRLSNVHIVRRLFDPYSSFYRRMYTMIVWFSNRLTGQDKTSEYKTPLDF